MIAKPWGTPWTFKYKPQVGGAYVEPAGSPSIYIFRDQPSEAAARAGTGAIGSVSTWSYDGTSHIASFTVPKVDDPQDGTRKRQYFLAINYFIDSASNQKQLDLRTFWLIVPDGMDEDPVPTPAEIQQEYDSNLGKEYGANANIFIEKFIRRAEASVKRGLKWSGYNWPKIENIGDLKDALAYKTLLFAYLDLSMEPGDIWKQRYDIIEEEYDELMKEISLQVVDYLESSDPEATPNSPKILVLLK